jgi:nitroreductase
MTVRQAVSERRSIRQYDTSQPVEEADLLAVLEAARLAASGCNSQPWRFIVIRDPETRERLAAEAMTLKQNQTICRQASVMIACLAVADAHCDIPDRIVELSQADPTAAEPTIAKRTGRLMRSRFDAMPPSQRAAYMALNTTIAITQMMLQATELGYGTCWLKAYDDAAAREILGIPEGLSIVAFTPLGRPAETPRQRPRLALSEIAFLDRYGEPLVP